MEKKEIRHLGFASVWFYQTEPLNKLWYSAHLQWATHTTAQDLHAGHMTERRLSGNVWTYTQSICSIISSLRAILEYSRKVKTFLQKNLNIYWKDSSVFLLNQMQIILLIKCEFVTESNHTFLFVSLEFEISHFTRHHSNLHSSNHMLFSKPTIPFHISFQSFIFPNLSLCPIKTGLACRLADPITAFAYLPIQRSRYVLIKSVTP